MPYRWTKEEIEDGQIVQSRQFDIAYSNYVSVINGGIDRDNLPEQCIDPEVNVAANGLGIAATSINIHNPFANNNQDSNYGAPFSNQNTRGNRITGLTYGEAPVDEGDNFFLVGSVNIDCEEGMLECAWKCNAYIPLYNAYYKNFTTTTLTRKRYQWQIRVNGIIVYESPAICEAFFTTNISTQIPISKGTQRVEVHIKIPGRSNEDNGMVVCQYWGGQILAYNTYR